MLKALHPEYFQPAPIQPPVMHPCGCSPCTHPARDLGLSRTLFPFTSIPGTSLSPDLLENICCEEDE